MTLLLLASLLAPSAHAQDTVDIGVLRDEDLHVVQNILYPKRDRSELFGSVGTMPFDAYLTTPNVQVGWQVHTSDVLAIGGVIGAGYGIKTGTYRRLESPAFGVAPYAFRYLTSVLGGVEWSPIYAKMSVSGARVLHFDVYFAGRGGLTVEQSVIPNPNGSNLAFAPTLSPAAGFRVWLNKGSALRFELRDDLLIERRAITASTHLKQNASLSVGYSVFSKGGK